MATRMNMSDLLTRTLDVKWAGSKDEVKSYGRGTEAVEFFGNTTPVLTVQSRDVDEFIAHLRSQGNGPATINRKLAALGTMFTVALRAGEISTRPLIEKQREPEHRIRVISKEEEERLLSVSPGWREVWAFLLDTGLRCGELISLPWSNVYGEEIHVRNTKGGSPRVIPLTKRTQDILNARRGLADRPFPITQSQLSKAWNRARKAMGLSDDREFVPHACRHTCASRLVRGGVRLIVVKEWLGHSNLSTTMRYAHLDSEALKRAASVLG